MSYILVTVLYNYSNKVLNLFSQLRINWIIWMLPLGQRVYFLSEYYEYYEYTISTMSGSLRAYPVQMHKYTIVSGDSFSWKTHYLLMNYTIKWSKIVLWGRISESFNNFLSDDCHTPQEGLTTHIFLVEVLVKIISSMNGFTIISQRTKYLLGWS